MHVCSVEELDINQVNKIELSTVKKKRHNNRTYKVLMNIKYGDADKVLSTISCT